MKLNEDGLCKAALLLNLPDVLQSGFAVAVVKMQDAPHVLASFGIRRNTSMSFNSVNSSVIGRETQFQIAAVTAE